MELFQTKEVQSHQQSFFPLKHRSQLWTCSKTSAAHTGCLVILVKLSTRLLTCTFVFHTKICSQIINKKKTHKLANTMIHLALSIAKAIGTRRQIPIVDMCTQQYPCFFHFCECTVDYSVCVCVHSIWFNVMQLLNEKNRAPQGVFLNYLRWVNPW